MNNAETTALYDRLGRIEEKIDRLAEQAPPPEQYRQLCTTVWGNGKRGLASRMDRVEWGFGVLLAIASVAGVFLGAAAQVFSDWWKR